MSEDYYTILGVSRSVTSVELKKAYRTKAMQYHPDRNPGDKEAEEKFKILSEAYETLSDKNKRAQYDQLGHDAYKNGASHGGFNQSGFGFSGSGFSDIFEEVFGDFMGGSRSHGRQSHGYERGEDLKYELELSLEEAYTGIEKDVTFNAPAKCDSCNGIGSTSNMNVGTCHACGGAGTVRVQQGFFMLERPCVTCRGQGTIIKNPCTKCRGTGVSEKRKTLKIKVPAGVPDNSRLRVERQGGAAPRNGVPGDLYVFISVLPHEIFEREENDLHCKFPITVIEAIQGVRKKIPTLNQESLEIVISPGTQPGTVLRLRGKGMPIHGFGSYGDLFLEISVEIPTKLTNKQKEILSDFYERVDTKKNHPGINSFWSKAKRLWGTTTSSNEKDN
jgi:molecular chaperone DnaJ